MEGRKLATHDLRTFPQNRGRKFLERKGLLTVLHEMPC